MESKFVVLSLIEEEVEWLRNVLVDVPIWDKLVTIIIIYYDNLATIFKAKSENYNGKAKTVRLKHNHVRSLIIDSIVAIQYMKFKENLVGQLSKCLNKELTSCMSRGMGLISR